MGSCALLTDALRRTHYNTSIVQFECPCQAFDARLKTAQLTVLASRGVPFDNEPATSGSLLGSPAAQVVHRHGAHSRQPASPVRCCNGRFEQNAVHTRPLQDETWIRGGRGHLPSSCGHALALTTPAWTPPGNALPATPRASADTLCTIPKRLHAICTKGERSVWAAQPFVQHAQKTAGSCPRVAHAGQPTWWAS